jgi:myo-inositol-1(or 4)-monophosphatase
VGQNRHVHNIAELQSIALTVAREAAALVAERRRGSVAVADRKSSSVDIVTAVDRESESFIRARLAELRPGDGFFGEEGNRESGSTGLTWIVDPIDGTVNFVYGIPAYAISIAVVEGAATPEEWTALAAVVINVANGEEYVASLGAGATLNGDALQVVPAPTLAEALLATGFAYDSERRSQQGEVIGRLIGQVRDIRRIGAASLDLCNVAANRVNIYFERGLMPWDHAAGVLIAQEAGATVRGLNGAAASANWCLAAHPQTIDEFEARALEAGANFTLR